MSADLRTVHARSRLLELVRYDRAGKWYLELRENPRIRERKTINEAVSLAAGDEFEVFLNRPGGGSFDRKIREAKP